MLNQIFHSLPHWNKVTELVENVINKVEIDQQAWTKMLYNTQTPRFHQMLGSFSTYKVECPCCTRWIVSRRVWSNIYRKHHWRKQHWSNSVLPWSIFSEYRSTVWDFLFSAFFRHRNPLLAQFGTVAAWQIAKAVTEMASSKASQWKDCSHCSSLSLCKDLPKAWTRRKESHVCYDSGTQTLCVNNQ